MLFERSFSIFSMTSVNSKYNSSISCVKSSWTSLWTHPTLTPQPPVRPTNQKLDVDRQLPRERLSDAKDFPRSKGVVVLLLLDGKTGKRHHVPQDGRREMSFAKPQKEVKQYDDRKWCCFLLLEIKWAPYPFLILMDHTAIFLRDF